MNNYFSHDSNARNSDKLIPLRMRWGAEGYGIYFMILERLREEPGYTSVKDYNMIAFDLRVDTGKVKSIVEDFGLFVFTEDGKYFYSESFKRRMEIKDDEKKKRSEAGKKGVAYKWGNIGQTDLSPSELRSKRLSLAREKGTHTNAEWKELKEFFGECVICGNKEKIVKDHIIPIYEGGSDAITNLQPLCSSCNSRKGSDNKDYRIEWCQSNHVEMPNKWLTKSEKCLTSKEKESKVNNLSIVSPLDFGEDDIVPVSYLKKIIFENEQEWYETIAMAEKLKPNEITMWLNNFFTYLECTGEVNKSLKNFKSHFYRWMKIELKGKNENQGTTESTTIYRRGHKSAQSN